MSSSTADTSVPDHEQVYELAGRYRLTRLLASGGMSAVWLADDTRLRRRVAVKVLAVALARDPRYVERFRREVRVGARLSHPNLVPIFDFGEEPWPYLVTEYVTGGTLSDRLQGPGGFAGDPLRLAVELLRALAHVHDAGIVHRDVTPANVLFDGGDGRARLTDFGIAQTPRETRLTQTGMVIGTLGYLGPEVLRGEDATVASDLYSLGVVLGEAAGSRAPAPLERLVARLTARTPAARPQSALGALQMLGANPSASLHAPHTASLPDAASLGQPSAAAPAPAGMAWGAHVGHEHVDPVDDGLGETLALPAAAATAPLRKEGATEAMAAPVAAWLGAEPPVSAAAALPGRPAVGDAATAGMPKREPTAALPAPAPAPVRLPAAAPAPKPARSAGARSALARRWIVRGTAVLALVALLLAAAALALRAGHLYGSHGPSYRTVFKHEVDALQHAVDELAH